MRRDDPLRIIAHGIACCHGLFVTDNLFCKTSLSI